MIIRFTHDNRIFPCSICDRLYDAPGSWHDLSAVPDISSIQIAANQERLWMVLEHFYGFGDGLIVEIPIESNDHSPANLRTIFLVLASHFEPDILQFSCYPFHSNGQNGASSLQLFREEGRRHEGRCNYFRWIDFKRQIEDCFDFVGMLVSGANRAIRDEPDAFILQL